MLTGAADAATPIAEDTLQTEVADAAPAAGDVTALDASADDAIDVVDAVAETDVSTCSVVTAIDSGPGADADTGWGNGGWTEPLDPLTTLKIYTTAQGCDDGDPCTDDVVAAASCGHVTVVDYSTCLSQDGCSHGACFEGKCSYLKAVNCDDGSTCTQDSCVLGTGCVHTATAEGQPCNDGDACTVGESCKAGTCTPASAIQCAALPCKSAVCDPGAGCVQKSIPCNDGLPCTTEGTTCGGTCTPGQPRLGAWSLSSMIPPGYGGMGRKIVATPDGFAVLYANHLYRTGPTGEVKSNIDVTSWPSVYNGYDLASSPDGSLAVVGGALPVLILLPAGATKPMVKVLFPGGFCDRGAVIWRDGGWSVASCGNLLRLLPDGTVTSHLNASAYRTWPLADGGWLADSTGPQAISSVERLDAAGKLLWRASVVSQFGDPGSAPDGRVWLAWSSAPVGQSLVAGGLAYVGLDLKGKILASRRVDFPTALAKVFLRIEATADGGALATASGYEDLPSEPSATMALVRMSSAGEVMWTHRWHGKETQLGRGVATVLADGDVAFVVGVGSLDLPWIGRLGPWGNETCDAAGICADVTPAACDDGVPCLREACDPKIGCAHVPAAWWCGDAEPCTQDVCSNKGCLHSGTTGNACEDGNPCTLGTACSSGVCQTSAGACDDDNPCTADSCGSGGCSHLQAAGPCDDGVACTTTTCAAGRCQIACQNCACQSDADCNLGSVCATARCVAGACVQPTATALLGEHTFSFTPTVVYDGTSLGAGGGVAVLIGKHITALRQDGSTIWQITLPEYPAEVLLRSDATALVATYGQSDTPLIAVDATGTQATVAMLPETSEVTGLSGDVAGGVWLMGRHTLPANEHTCRLWRLQADGTPAWFTDPTGMDTCSAAVTTATGEFLVAGSHDTVTLQNGNTFHDYTTLIGKLTAAGKEVWVKPLGSGWASGLFKDGQGGWGVVVSGAGVSWVRFNVASGEVEGRRWIAYSSGLDISAVQWPGGGFVALIGSHLRFVDGRGVVWRTEQAVTTTFVPTNLAWGQAGTLQFARKEVGYPNPKQGELQTMTRDAWGHDNCLSSGVCSGKAATTCLDENPCTADTCDAILGCVHPALDDGSPCGAKGYRCRTGQCLLAEPW